MEKKIESFKGWIKEIEKDDLSLKSKLPLGYDTFRWLNEMQSKIFDLEKFLKSKIGGQAFFIGLLTSTIDKFFDSKEMTRRVEETFQGKNIKVISSLAWSFLNKKHGMRLLWVESVCEVSSDDDHKKQLAVLARTTFPHLQLMSKFKFIVGLPYLLKFMQKENETVPKDEIRSRSVH